MCISLSLSILPRIDTMGLYNENRNCKFKRINRMYVLLSYLFCRGLIQWENIMKSVIVNLKKNKHNKN
jgi:hypothetical protein